MACYCSIRVRYRGRLVRVYLRYCCYQSAEVIYGKPLRLRGDWYPTKDDRRLARLVERRQVGAGCNVQ